MQTGRFAPTTSGRAHPGTLLAGLLAWLDVRSQGGRFVLRLEDIDPAAQDETVRRGLVDDLAWFGLEWDELVWQTHCTANHEAALDRLAALGVLYECDCSRSVVKAAALPSAAGGWVYPGTCRPRRLADWRASRHGLRADLGDFRLALTDEGGTDLSQNVATAMGDPLVRRADGGVTYQLAVVADDAAAGVTRIVRGRDIASSTATQAALFDLLQKPRPVWLHHLLLLEPRGDKLAKFHQSVSVPQLKANYTPDALRGVLAYAGGLQTHGAPVTRDELLAGFSWNRVRATDVVVKWTGDTLELGGLRE